ncbi:MAPEG family protein [compost metagenome]
MNSFEITPAFAAAVIIAYISEGAELVTINVLAVMFITSRLLYIICYLADWAVLRSLVWFVGMGIVASFFFVSM